RSRPSVLARLVVALHAARPARRRVCDGRPGMVRRRTIPRTEHLRPLSALSRQLDGARVDGSRARGCERALDEPRWRSGYVGAKDESMTAARPAFYAARPGGWREWWTILHPPYTAWHLSYVVIGATLAPRTDGGRLTVTALAFFLAVGVAAHALDELHGRPLHTDIPSAVLG